MRVFESLLALEFCSQQNIDVNEGNIVVGCNFLTNNGQPNKIKVGARYFQSALPMFKIYERLIYYIREKWTYVTSVGSVGMWERASKS